MNEDLKREVRVLTEAFVRDVVSILTRATTDAMAEALRAGIPRHRAKRATAAPMARGTRKVRAPVPAPNDAAPAVVGKPDAPFAMPPSVPAIADEPAPSSGDAGHALLLLVESIDAEIAALLPGTFVGEP